MLFLYQQVHRLAFVQNHNSQYFVTKLHSACIIKYFHRSLSTLIMTGAHKWISIFTSQNYSRLINFKIQTATTKRVTLRNLFSCRNEYLKFNFILILTPIQFLPANTYLSTVIRCFEIISTIMSFWWTKIKEQKHKSYADQIDRRHMADCQTTENRRWCIRLLVHTVFLFASPSPPAWYLHWHLISIWANRRL